MYIVLGVVVVCYLIFYILLVGISIFTNTYVYILYYGRFIVEQQYSKAVVIVLKTRAYVNTISHELHLSLNKNNTTSTSTTTNNIKNYRNSVAATQAAEIAAAVASAQTEAIIAVLNRIDELCVHLAGTIRKSILNLPTSAVSDRSMVAVVVIVLLVYGIWCLLLVYMGVYTLYYVFSTIVYYTAVLYTTTNTLLL